MRDEELRRMTIEERVARLESLADPALAEERQNAQERACPLASNNISHAMVDAGVSLTGSCPGCGYRKR